MTINEYSLNSFKNLIVSVSINWGIKEAIMVVIIRIE